MVWLATIFTASLVYLAVYYRQNIVDYYVVNQFSPSSQLQAVLDKTYLNDKGKFYVYASQTKVVDKQEFNQYCGSLQSEKSIVLGCYAPATKQIAVFDVKDPRLNGVREATTAHEMLHAVWDRLSASDQKRLTNLLNAEASKITDQRLKNLFEQYRKSDPSSLPNEFHSIIGTEVSEVSPELEAHYQQFFTNRQTLVEQTRHYEEVFVNLESRQNAVVSRMNELNDSLNARSTEYEKQLTLLNRDIDSFNNWADNSYASEYEFDRRRNSLMTRIDSLEVDRLAINTDVEEYGRLRIELEELNMLAIDLNSSMNSNIRTIEQAPSL